MNAKLIATLSLIIASLVLGCFHRGAVPEETLPTYPTATAGDEGVSQPMPAPQQDAAGVTTYNEAIVNCTFVMRQRGRQEAATQMLSGEAADAFVDKYVVEQCRQSRPAPGVQLPVSVPAATGESSAAESADNEPPSPSAPSADLIDEDPKRKHLRSFLGITGDIKPSGCSGASCLYLAKVPYVFGTPMCEGISVRIDDRDVKWLSAGRVVTARVNPGEGFESLDGNRVSILRAGEHGFVRLTAPRDGVGMAYPSKIRVGEHAIEATCWNIVEEPMPIGDGIRTVRFVTKTGTYRGKIANGVGRDPIPYTLPFADAWQR